MRLSEQGSAGPGRTVDQPGHDRCRNASEAEWVSARCETMSAQATSGSRTAAGGAKEQAPPLEPASPDSEAAQLGHDDLRMTLACTPGDEAQARR